MHIFEGNIVPMFIHHLASSHFIFSFVGIIMFFTGCSSKKELVKEEQIELNLLDVHHVPDSLLNGVQGGLSFDQVHTVPNQIVLTGIREHRLITLYKPTKEKATTRNSYSGWYYDEEGNNERKRHYMPGIDLIYGYHLLNVAHFDLKAEKLRLLFDHPVLIKSLYYPSYVPDSIDKKPVNRDYYLVSVYDEDTNKDTLINNKDLRRMYLFNVSCTEKTQLIPADHSVIRSQYDPKNDIMYIFAREDVNKDGKAEKDEPLHVFWIDLKTPAPAKRMY